MPAIIDASQNLGPYAEDLVRGGVHTVIRYYNHSNNNPSLPSKRLEEAELTQLSDAGLSVAVVFQQNARDIRNFSAASGQSDAARALDLAQRYHQPRNSGIYFAVDRDFVGSDARKRITDYFAQVRRIAGGDYRIGAYGSGHVLRHLLNDELIDLAWLSQSTGWTGYRAMMSSHDWTLRQLGQRNWPGHGFPYDPNKANPAFSDFGQFSLSAQPVGPAPAASNTSLMHVIARTGLNMRRGPGLDYGVIQTLPSGNIVESLGRIGDWVAVDLEGDGQLDGYVHGGFLALVAEGRAPVRDSRKTPFEIAQEELLRGVQEVPGPGDNPRISLYHASTGSGAPDAVAWCSSFVNWCVTQSGRAGTNSKWAMSWHDTGWGTAVSGDPQPGDIAVYKRHYRRRDGSAAIGGHVGFVDGLRGDSIDLLGGNQGNRVSIAPYPRTQGTRDGQRYELLSFRRS